jgi:hypothetical protein
VAVWASYNFASALGAAAAGASFLREASFLAAGAGSFFASGLAASFLASLAASFFGSLAASFLPSASPLRGVSS